MHPLLDGEIAVLRNASSTGESYSGFMWPITATSDDGTPRTVKAPDWQPTKQCGNGLHGWAKGEGDLSVGIMDDHSTRLWYVVVVREDTMISLGGKVKFPSCRILFTGSKTDAANLVKKLHPESSVHFCQVQGGDGSTLTGGNYSTLTGGNYSTLTGGRWSKLTGGNYSKLTGGDGSTLTGGNYSTLTGGYESTLTGGDYSTLTGGDYSTLTGGDESKLTGGYGSTFTGGDGSTLTGGDGSKLTGGDYSTLTGGDYSTLQVRRWDGNRYRMHTAYVGEGVILAGVPYKLNDAGVFVAVPAAK